MTFIKIRNAHEHNLKNLDLGIPRNKLVVFTGVSGSGKSSLLFDTIYTEAQRQYLECLSVYARARLPKLSRPKAGEISGLSAALVLDQKRMGRNPRSTVGTVTEIYALLRLLYSRCGTPRIGDSNLFSFNNPEGACPVCRGLGEKMVLNMDSLLDRQKSLAGGAILHSEYRLGGRRWNIVRASGFFDMDKPVKEFSKKELDCLLYSRHIKLNQKDTSGFIQSYSFEGIVIGIMRRRLDKRGLSISADGRDTRFFSLSFCDICGGSRLNKKANKVKINGASIGELAAMELTELYRFVSQIKSPVAEPIIRKIKDGLSSLLGIGVGYLSLNRPVGTLSGGESQRVKMSKQLQSDLIEMLYILDEPSIGLHPKDIDSLLVVLQKLRDKGNSVLVVEHDPAVIKAADYIVDVGPGAGRYGGSLVYAGEAKGLSRVKRSRTASYLNKKSTILVKKSRQAQGFFQIEKANLHNLKNISVNMPKGVFLCITGVAGSGKSTLINDIFVPSHPEAIVVTQNQVGKNIRSCPASYIGIMGAIRSIFGRYFNKSASLFSFNSAGACQKCHGLGFAKIDMHFLGSIKIVCSLCRGRRFRQEVLNLRLKGKNMNDILHMTVKEAEQFFDNTRINYSLGLLEEVGLGYLELGQALPSLSGGESQRIKLVKELSKSGRIYVLDEPTTGLHMADIAKLLAVLNKLVDRGNSLIVIEHNLDIISQADWIIDLGPGGGNKGGRLIAQGTLKDIVRVKKSATAQYLQSLPKGKDG